VLPEDPQITDHMTDVDAAVDSPYSPDKPAQSFSPVMSKRAPTIVNIVAS